MGITETNWCGSDCCYIWGGLKGPSEELGVLKTVRADFSVGPGRSQGEAAGMWSESTGILTRFSDCPERKHEDRGCSPSDSKLLVP